MLARQQEVKEVECLPFDVDGDCAFKVPCIKEQMMKLSYNRWNTLETVGNIKQG